MLRTQLYWEQKLREYTDVLHLMLCRRCGHYAFDIHPRGYLHHHGGLQLEISRNNGMNLDEIHDWSVEEEHGLLHGFLVGFFAFQKLLKEQSLEELIKDICEITHNKNIPEKLIASCLLHDYAKVNYGFKNHDSNLKNHFPDLLEETYSHTNPEKESNLVIGDRIELRRYFDWKSWCHFDLDEYVNETPEEMEYFYSDIRPVLAQLFKYRHDVWIKHGVEGKGKNQLQFPLINYPQSFMHKGHKDSFISVETGSLNAQMGSCLFKHSRNFQPSGYIPNTVLRKSKYKVEALNKPNNDGKLRGKDHLVLPNNCQLPAKDWIFLYEYPAMKKKYNDEQIENFAEYTNGIEVNLSISILHVTDKIIQLMKLFA
jgi:hypothetical protein